MPPTSFTTERIKAVLSYAPFLVMTLPVRIKSDGLSRSTVFKMIWPIVATSEVPVYLPDGRRLRIFDWTSFNKNGADACPTILPML